MTCSPQPAPRVIPLLALALTASTIFAASHPDPPSQPSAPTKTIAAATASMRHTPGLLPLDWDATSGKLYLEVPLTAADHTRSSEYIYTHSLPYGMGSNDVGLDRGQISRGALVYFERTGPKLLLIQPNEE